MEQLDYLYTGDAMFDIIRMIVTLIFILVFAIIITSIVKVISEWSNNNKQPVLDINCKVVSKRNHTSVRAAYHDVGETSYHLPVALPIMLHLNLKVKIEWILKSLVVNLAC